MRTSIRSLVPNPRAPLSSLLLWSSIALLSLPAWGQPVRQAYFGHATETIAARARRVPIGGSFRLQGVPLEPAMPVTLVLERFEVFTPDARIVVHGALKDQTFAVPPRVYLRGEVFGDPASLAFLSVAADGSIRGFVYGRGHLHSVGQDEGAGAGAPLEVRRVEDLLSPRGAAQEAEPVWSCLGGLGGAASFDSLAAPVEAREVGPASFASFFSAEIALETDFEFYDIFDNVHAAADYVGDLFGAISAIYYRDIGTTLKVRYLSLWTAKGAGYPWGTGSSSCVTLVEFGNYWHVNKTGVPRDTAHFLSGRAFNNGIAWVGSLCSGDSFQALTCEGTTYGTWAGGYGATHGINGQFSLSNPSFFWDIEATAHELGHNFNSPHTHCYNNIPSGGAPPVDQCFSGECKQFNQQGQCVSACYEGPTSVPSGGGSIMSYCQLKPGGFNNVNLSFGQAGLYGSQSERVPARMRSFVESRSCLAFLPARVADLNGDGRSDVILRRGDGQWWVFPLWPGN